MPRLSFHFHYLVILIIAASSLADSTLAANVSDEYLKSCGPDQTIIHRKRRLLTFPPRSEVLLRISLLKSTPWRTNVFTIHEIDVQVPIPENLNAILFENGTAHHKPKARMENRFVDYISQIATMMGLNGHECVRKFQCEIGHVKPYFVERSFLLQTLGILFRSRNEFNQTLLCSQLDCEVSFVPDFMIQTD